MTPGGEIYKVHGEHNRQLVIPTRNRGEDVDGHRHVPVNDVTPFVDVLEPIEAAYDFGALVRTNYELSHKHHITDRTEILVREFPFTYLALPIGSNMRRVSVWRHVVEKVKKRLTEWRAKSMSFSGRLTLVKSVLGVGERKTMSWVKWESVLASYGAGELNIGSLHRRVGDGGILTFGQIGGGEIRALRIDLLGFITWIGLMDVASGRQWSIHSQGASKMMDNKYLHEKDSRHETVWNKIVPKKVNIFIWRALKGRLPVRSELDKR
ncbi:reverse transcriptase domain, reverse transcriptase zinc-binding domain protein, partial [Tanacetum coccineum]